MPDQRRPTPPATDAIDYARDLALLRPLGVILKYCVCSVLLKDDGHLFQKALAVRNGSPKILCDGLPHIG
jgi:hypothetical protein